MFLMNATTITRVATCTICKNKSSITVPATAFEAWATGTAVQDAFPMITAEEREFFFISLVCSSCWDTLFQE